MFKTPIYHDPFSGKFDQWAEGSLSGTWKITLDADSYIMFSDKSDATLYHITWYKRHTYSVGHEVGLFYCPYVPTR